MTDSGDAIRPVEQDVLDAFREYFSAFTRGGVEDLCARVSLPFFDIRDGEISEMRSEAQLAGFRRGLLARMATPGVGSSSLAHARVLMAEDGLALVHFEDVRVAADGSSRGRTKSVAFMRRDAGARWRAWMISVLRVQETEGLSEP